MAIRNPERFRTQVTNVTTYSRTFRRSRILLSGSPVGDWTTQIDDTYDFDYPSRLRETFDTVGYRDRDNQFGTSYSLRNPGRLVAFQSNIADYVGGYSQEVELTQDVAIPADYMSYGSDQDLEDVIFVTKAAAETNPSAADFQATAFLAELRDLPSLFKSTGETLAKFGANEYLKFQYGWRPFVRDLRNFFSQAERVEKRIRSINTLERRGQLRRRYDPNEWKYYEYSGVPGYFNVNLLDGDVDYHYNTQLRVKRWCDVVWLPEPPPPSLFRLDQKYLDRARQAVYGTSLDGPTLWQIMPWSWLIDWNTNNSEYIMSQNNVVGAKFGRSVLMKTTEVRSTVTPVRNIVRSISGSNEYTAGFGTYSETKKERLLNIAPQAVSTGEFANILDSGFKVSILAALGIQRLRR